MIRRDERVQSDPFLSFQIHQNHQKLDVIRNYLFLLPMPKEIVLINCYCNKILNFVLVLMLVHLLALSLCSCMTQSFLHYFILSFALLIPFSHCLSLCLAVSISPSLARSVPLTCSLIFLTLSLRSLYGEDSWQVLSGNMTDILYRPCVCQCWCWADNVVENTLCLLCKKRNLSIIFTPSSGNLLHFFYTLPLNLVILVKCHSSITFDFWDWKKFGGREEGNKHNSHSVYLTLKPLPDSALSVSPNLESSLQGRTLLNSMSQNTVELAHLSSPLCTAVGRVYAQYSLFAPGMYWSSRRHAVLEIAPTGTESCRRDKYLAGAEWKTAGCYVSLVTTPHPYSLSLCLCLSTSPNSEQDDLSEKQTLTFAHQGLWFTHCWSGSVLWNSGSALKYRVSAINQKE